MGELYPIYLKLMVEDGAITSAERIDPELKKWVPGTIVKDLREKRIRGIQGLAFSQQSPDCIIVPVKIGGATVYVEICPTTVDVGLTFPPSGS